MYDVCMERITVNLTDKAATALSNTATLAGLNKTDVVNRALQLYAWVETELARGSELRMVDSDGLVEKIRLM